MHLHRGWLKDITQVVTQLYCNTVMNQRGNHRTHSRFWMIANMGLTVFLLAFTELIHVHVYHKYLFYITSIN